MNSEVWVCITDKERCLPFMLVETGYDVWVSASENGRTELTDRLAWEQSWEQILQKVNTPFS